jgi:WD40 repeat protein
LASGSVDKTVRIWDTSSGECVHELKGHSDWVQSVCYSPDGKTLASGSRDNTVRIWDTSSGECISVEKSLPDSFKNSSEPFPYDGSKTLCVDVFASNAVSIDSKSHTTFYNNTVLIHTLNQ